MALSTYVTFQKAKQMHRHLTDKASKRPCSFRWGRRGKGSGMAQTSPTQIRRVKCPRHPSSACSSYNFIFANSIFHVRFHVSQSQNLPSSPGCTCTAKHGPAPKVLGLETGHAAEVQAVRGTLRGRQVPPGGLRWGKWRRWHSSTMTSRLRAPLRRGRAFRTENAARAKALRCEMSRLVQEPVA